MCAAGVGPDFACVLQVSSKTLHVCNRCPGGPCMCVTSVQEYIACIIQVLGRFCISVTRVQANFACMIQA